MTDTKEALPVVAWLCEFVTACESTERQVVFEDPDGLRFGDIGEPSPFRTAPLTDHATATAALSELRAEVERYKQARNDIKALYQAQTINNQNYSNHWHEAIDAALEAFDDARAGSSGIATENKPSQPNESNPAQP